MSQALYRKYRPKDWDEVVGQDHMITALNNAIASLEEDGLSFLKEI